MMRYANQVQLGFRLLIQAIRLPPPEECILLTPSLQFNAVNDIDKEKDDFEVGFGSTLMRCKAVSHYLAWKALWGIRETLR